MAVLNFLICTRYVKNIHYSKILIFSSSSINWMLIGQDNDCVRTPFMYNAPRNLWPVWWPNTCHTYNKLIILLKAVWTNVSVDHIWSFWLHSRLLLHRLIMGHMVENHMWSNQKTNHQLQTIIPNHYYIFEHEAWHSSDCAGVRWRCTLYRSSQSLVATETQAMKF